MRHEALAKAREDPRGTPARILDAAEDVFAEQGYAAASTREIARRARVPFGGLHYHWGSKKQLWEAVFKRLGERTRDTLVRNLVPGGTPGETLDNLTDAFFEMLIANPNTVRLAFRMALEPRELHLLTVRQMFRELSDLGVGIFRELLPSADIDAPAAIHVVSCAFLGAIADADGQVDLLGGNVFTSRAARERLRAQLRRLARALFEVGE
jgi:AcrR family transcriptional regulator